MDISEMSFEEVKKRKDLLEEYKKLLQEIKTNSFAKKIVEENYGKRVIDIYQILEEELINNTSMLLFPNDIVILYPNIRRYYATKNISCNFSGREIRKGQSYLYYRPLLNNITKNSAYVLRNTIKTCDEYETYLPNNIFEFEQLESNIVNDLTDDDICYSELNRKYGHLSLLKLKRK